MTPLARAWCGLLVASLLLVNVPLGGLTSSQARSATLTATPASCCATTCPDAETESAAGADETQPEPCCPEECACSCCMLHKACCAQAGEAVPRGEPHPRQPSLPPEAHFGPPDSVFRPPRA